MTRKAKRTTAPFGRPKPRDALAGFVTGLFSIPEGMAYASIGGFAAPLGLWSGIVPTIIGSVFARTVLMVTTLTSAIALSAQSVLAAAGSDPGDLGALAMLTVLVGVVMLVMGLLRLGSVMSFVSTAVMTGFTVGIALQIIAGVVKDATGYAPESSNTFVKIVEAGVHVGQWQLSPAVVTLVTVAVWFVFHLIRWTRALAMLIAFVLVTVVTSLLGTDLERVADIAAVPRSLPPFTLPDLSEIPALAAGAVAIALVALAQAAGIGAAVANPDGSPPNASKDFTAQGLANIAGGFFGALPTGGSLSRTGVAQSAGATTRWTGIFAGVWLAVIVLLVGPYAGAIPMAVIGGLMLVIGFELIAGRFRDIRLVARTSLPSAAAMVVTFVATTAMPLQYAIFLGAGLSILLTAITVSRRGRLIELARDETGGWTLQDPPERLASGRTTVLHYFGSGFFSEVSRIDHDLPDLTDVHDAAVVLSMRGWAGVPSATFLKVLDARVQDLQQRGIVIVLSGVSPKLHELLRRSGAVEHLGREQVVDATPRLMESVERAYERAEALRTGTAVIEDEPGAR
ncbi:SulP family inorganic anion transporter [Agromyces sp. NPDC058110]|uniref:SulP family inorganic anion transporter n=1 Tax=Agromyces sp. NPDC058110 TaxID=3346345 RepID=UPI0036DD610A